MQPELLLLRSNCTLLIVLNPWNSSEAFGEYLAGQHYEWKYYYKRKAPHLNKLISENG